MKKLYYLFSASHFFCFPFIFKKICILRGRLVSFLESHFRECDSKKCDSRELKSRKSDFVMFGIPRKC